MHTEGPMSQYAGISGAQNFHFVFIKQKSSDDVLRVGLACCKKTAICKWDIEPTVLTLYFPTVAESDQSSHFVYPHCAIRSWPVVAMVPGLTRSQLQNRCYPSA